MLRSYFLPVLSGLLLSFHFLVGQLVLAQDNLIVYPGRVGAITAQSNEEKLAAIYGKSNLSREIRPWSDDGYGCATVLFKGSNKEIEVFWQGETNDYEASLPPEQQKRCETLPDRQIPAGIEISTDFKKEPPQHPTYWKTPEGVFVGISLLDLEAMNAAPIDFESSESCADGGIRNWNDGKLKQLEDLLAYSRLSYPWEELERWRKNGTVSSKSLPKALKERVFLSKIALPFPVAEK